MNQTPAEIVAGYFALIGSPVLGLLIVTSGEAWQLKAIALASVGGLLLHTIRRLRTT